MHVSIVYLPIAVSLIFTTCTVKLADNALLRISTGWRGPLSSAALYVNWLNFMVEAVIVNSNNNDK